MSNSRTLLALIVSLLALIQPCPAPFIAVLEALDAALVACAIAWVNGLPCAPLFRRDLESLSHLESRTTLTVPPGVSKTDFMNCVGNLTESYLTVYRSPATSCESDGRQTP